MVGAQPPAAPPAAPVDRNVPPAVMVPLGCVELDGVAGTGGQHRHDGPDLGVRDGEPGDGVDIPGGRGGRHERQGARAVREGPEARSRDHHNAVGRATARRDRRDGRVRERRGLEAEHHHGHRNPDSGYASAHVPTSLVPFQQTHCIFLSFRIDIRTLPPPQDALFPASFLTQPSSSGHTTPGPREVGKSTRIYTPCPRESNIPGPISRSLLSSLPTAKVCHSYYRTISQREGCKERVGRCAYTKSATHPPPMGGVDRDPHSLSGMPTVTRPDRAASITAPTRLLTPSLP